jgi:hypothetical protein
MRPDVREAVARRNSGLARTRRLTGLSLVGGLGLTLIVSAVAAGSTHARKLVSHVAHTRRRPAAVPNAPAPPLVPARSVEAPSTPAAPTPSPAPAPTPAAPVVVSGGS